MAYPHIQSEVDNYNDTVLNFLVNHGQAGQIFKINSSGELSWANTTLNLLPTGIDNQVLKTVANQTAWADNNEIYNSDKSSILNIENDKLTFKSNLTGSDVITEWTDGNGDTNFQLYADGSLAIKHSLIYEDNSILKFKGSNFSNITGFLFYDYKNNKLLELQNNVNEYLKIYYQTINIPAISKIRNGSYSEFGFDGIYDAYIKFDGIVGSNTGRSFRIKGRSNIVFARMTNVGLSLFKNDVEAEEVLDVIDTTKAQGHRREITVVNAPIYTTGKNNHILEIDASSNAVQVELLEPSNANSGQEFIIDIYDATNEIRLLAFSNSLFNVNTITDEGNNIFRYTMNGNPDLSSVNIGDLIKTTNATNTENNGIWEITGVDNNSHYIEITNVNGISESISSYCKLQLNILNNNTFVPNEKRTYVAYSHRNKYKKL